MSLGRKFGLLVAGGVICGAITWGTLAAVGVSALMASKPEALVFIRIFGSIYLIYLSLKSFSKIFSRPKIKAEISYTSNHISFLKGYGIHMSNPEAMMGWIAIISLGVNKDSPEFAPFYIVLGCIMIAVTIYSSYAYLFSTSRITTIYTKFSKAIEGVFVLIFGFAGISLFLTVL